MKTRASVLTVLVIMCVCCSGGFCPAFAVWQEGGNPVCAAARDQGSQEIVPDGAGGAIIAWYDGRTGWDSYVQHMRADGTPAWTIDGVCVSNVYTDHYNPQPLSDGAGGAIVVWADYRSGKWDIYAQRVRADGTLAWGSGGLPVCTVPGTHGWPRVVSDGAGGAIVAWEDLRNGNFDIYAQRIDANCTLMWPVDGIAVCTASGEQRNIEMASDGLGGALMTWNDARSGLNVYAQRVNAVGTTLWTIDGAAVCTASGDQSYPQISSDGAGGAVLTWNDLRISSYSSYIYAQRINAAGAPLWTSDGVAVSLGIGREAHPRVASDGTGGAIVAWDAYRGGPSYDIYARRVSAGGVPMWTADGVKICGATYDQQNPEMISDGLGGAIVTWPDWRNGYIDIYAQRVGGDGASVWNADGVRLSTAWASELAPQIASDGAGGTIVAWVEWHDATSYDICAQRVYANGTGGPTPVTFTAASAKTGNGCVTLSWQVTVEVPVSSFVIRRSRAETGEFADLDVTVSEPSHLSFACTDYSVQPGETYWYNIVLSGPSGEESYGPIRACVETVPVAYRAYQSYPNPFNPVCTIRYDLPTASGVSLRVFDVEGSLVRTLVNGWREPGVYSEVWDGRADDGNALPSGVYFYSVKAGEFVGTHKMVLLE